MLIRAKFSELYPVKYISHLELMETFRRAFRRAGLSLAYSQGFNPHMILSLGQPLKVGMIGRAEYFDLELAEEMKMREFIKMANKNLPEGIEILEARNIPENLKSLMAVINTADYILNMDFADNTAENVEKQELMLDKFLGRESIEVIRHRRNKKDRELDIRPLIYDAYLSESGRWLFRVKTGSNGNLRPEELIRAIADYFLEVREIPVIKVEREGLYVNIGDKFYSPLDDKVIGS
ncbi:MAG: TIGR03936 family radical SAM-associated protein [Halanaerobiales bacterium]